MSFRSKPFPLYGLILLLVPLPGLATQCEPLASTSAETLVALFGDSITTGYNSNFQDDVAGGTHCRGVPTSSLNDLFAAPEKRDVIVSNWGDGGTSSANGVSRIANDLNSNSAMYSGEAKYVLIMYGTNDPAFNISASTTGFNVGDMVRRAGLVGYTSIVGTLTPRDDLNVQPINDQVKSAAASKGAALVDHFARFIAEPTGWRSLLEEEVSGNNTIRLHPTDAGYQVIAQTWFDETLAGLIDPQPQAVIVAPIVGLLLGD